MCWRTGCGSCPDASCLTLRAPRYRWLVTANAAALLYRWHALPQLVAPNWACVATRRKRSDRAVQRLSCLPPGCIAQVIDDDGDARRNSCIEVQCCKTQQDAAKERATSHPGDFASRLLKKRQRSRRPGKSAPDAAPVPPWTTRHLGVLPGSVVSTVVLEGFETAFVVSQPIRLFLTRC